MNPVRAGRGALGIVSALLIVTIIGGWMFFNANDDQTHASERPDVVLGSGNYAGHEWVYGISEPVEEAPCWELIVDGSNNPSGCVTFRPDIAAMTFFAAGTADGLRTQQGLVSEEVASVVSMSGGHEFGEAHIFNEGAAGHQDLRPVIAFVTTDELRGGSWTLIAYDENDRELARSEAFP